MEERGTNTAPMPRPCSTPGQTIQAGLICRLYQDMIQVAAAASSMPVPTSQRVSTRWERRATIAMERAEPRARGAITRPVVSAG